MRRARAKQGSVVLDKRSKVWHYYWWEAGRRHSKKIGTKAEFLTKTLAWQAAKPLRDAVENQVTITSKKPTAPMVTALVEQYRQERMPRRAMTRQGYNTWLNQYIIPRWGDRPITDLQARPVDLWLQSLPLAPKSKVHIRGLVRLLWDYAIYLGSIPMQRNPAELIRIEGASKRTRPPRSLTVEEFQQLLRHLEQPFDVMAVLCAVLGLRISECLALKWSDVHWLNGTLCVERSIVHQKVDDVKTPESQRVMHIDVEVLEVLKRWKQTSQFTHSEDWLFGSPVQLGRLPFSYSGVWQALRKAAAKAGIDHLSSHVFRHTHRTWLDAVGTSVGIQQRMMRHASVTTTMNVYGAANTEDMKQAHERVVQLAFATNGNGR